MLRQLVCTPEWSMETTNWETCIIEQLLTPHRNHSQHSHSVSPRRDASAQVWTRLTWKHQNQLIQDQGQVSSAWLNKCILFISFYFPERLFLLSFEIWFDNVTLMSELINLIKNNRVTCLHGPGHWCPFSFRSSTNTPGSLLSVHLKEKHPSEHRRVKNVCDAAEETFQKQVLSVQLTSRKKSFIL